MGKGKRDNPKTGYIEIEVIDWNFFWLLAFMGWVVSVILLFVAILGAVPFLNYFVWRWFEESEFFKQKPSVFYKTKRIKVVIENEEEDD